LYDSIDSITGYHLCDQKLVNLISVRTVIRKSLEFFSQACMYTNYKKHGDKILQ